MPEVKQTIEIEPISFLSLEREFYATAERAFDLGDSFNKPLYFLYFHTLELAFKAFLRSHNVPTRELKDKKGHELTELYEACCKLGLVIGTSDPVQIGNIVKMLKGANEYQGLRYFNPDLSALPSLAWTREVVLELIQIVELRLQAASMAAFLPASKLVIIWDKPTPKS
jgi:hypothetical protein